MIQRIQTVYLALVFLLVAAMSFLPLIVFHADETVFYMNLFRFEGGANFALHPVLPNIWPLPILASLLAILSIISIFRFRNRRQQLLINSLNMLVNFGLLVLIFVFADAAAKLVEVEDRVIYDVAAYFPILTVLFLILANRSIRKDEKLVKAADRLR
jgi:hypothetical protein